MKLVDTTILCHGHYDHAKAFFLTSSRENWGAAELAAGPRRAMNFCGIRRDSDRADLPLFPASLDHEPQAIP